RVVVVAGGVVVAVGDRAQVAVRVVVPDGLVLGRIGRGPQRIAGRNSPSVGVSGRGGGERGRVGAGHVAVRRDHRGTQTPAGVVAVAGLVPGGIGARGQIAIAVIDIDCGVAVRVSGRGDIAGMAGVVMVIGGRCSGGDRTVGIEQRRRYRRQLSGTDPADQLVGHGGLDRHAIDLLRLGDRGDLVEVV